MVKPLVTPEAQTSPDVEVQTGGSPRQRKGLAPLTTLARHQTPLLPGAGTPRSWLDVYIVSSADTHDVLRIDLVIGRST